MACTCTITVGGTSWANESTAMKMAEKKRMEAKYFLK
jgi:hypothetical protein